MNNFLPSYNDPIVSILLFLGIIFIVSILSYIYSVWKQEQNSKELINFLKNFESQECALDTQNMEFDPSMKKPLFLLALAYQKSGEYSKAINLYHYLIEHTKDSALLKNLADTYFKAGFLQRALDIYLQIISKQPRSVDVLYQIENIYEKLNNFESAKDALEVLEAQGENVEALKINLKYQEITKSFKPANEQFEELIKLMQNTNRYKSFIVRKLFKLNPKEAFKYYKDEYFLNLIDILEKLKKEHLNFDIINSSIYLRELFFLKGYIENCNKSSGIFALQLLNCAKKEKCDIAQLKFLYICKKCKQSFPLQFLRCPNCNRVYTSKIEVLVEEKQQKNSHSLQ